MALTEEESATEVEQDGQPRLVIEKRWVLKNPGKSSKWWVALTKDDSQGRSYIRLSKFDRSFVWFCFHKGMNFAEGKKLSANVQQFDELLKKRKAASIQAVHTAIGSEASDSQQSQLKKRKVREEDKTLCQDWVTVELDEVKNENGDVVGGHAAKTLWGLDLSTLWIELTETNLLYMKEMVKAGQKEKLFGKSKSAAKSKASPLKDSPNKKARALANTSPKLKRRKPFFFLKGAGAAGVDPMERSLFATDAKDESGADHAEVEPAPSPIEVAPEEPPAAAASETPLLDTVID